MTAPNAHSGPPAANALSPGRFRLAMLALALGGFGIGTTEFVAMGLLRDVADSFGVSEASAGRVISAYALGVVVGAPVLTVAAARVPRRALLVMLMAAFALGNAVTVFASSMPLLVASRFLTGLPHGAFFGVASVVAAHLAGPGRRATAVSQVLAGLTVATLCGVPAATWIGAALGWRWAFGLCAVIGLATVAAVLAFVAEPHGLPVTDPRTELGALRREQVWLTLAVGTVGFGGMFALYSYIAWTMTEIARVDRGWMWAVLMVYGLGMVVGNFAGGVLADRNLRTALRLGLVLMALVLVGFAAVAGVWWAAVLGVFCVGYSGSSLVPGLQMRLMLVAEGAQNLAAALNHSALNVANALGAFLGGLVISWGWGYRAPAVAGSVLAVCGLAVLLWAQRRERAGLGRIPEAAPA